MSYKELIDVLYAILEVHLDIANTFKQSQKLKQSDIAENYSLNNNIPVDDPYGNNKITWYVGPFANKRLAKAEDGFAWTFGYDTNENPNPEAKELLEEIQKYGKVEALGYEFTLGGRDNRLINRRIPKNKEC
jgi:hypothetical protein